MKDISPDMMACINRYGLTIVSSEMRPDTKNPGTEKKMYKTINNQFISFDTLEMMYESTKPRRELKCQKQTSK